MPNESQQVRELVITRIFDAPRELVFRAWTEPDRLAQWWGPKGFALTVVKLDLRPGGIFHYRMQSGDGAFTMWGKFVYGEIVAPEKIVFVSSFSDEECNLTRHPMSDSWPLEISNILTFIEVKGRTTLTLRGTPVGATKQELETFAAGRESMSKGFGGTFEQLDAYLQAD